MVNHYNTIIVGAGQAGLALGYYLKKKQVSFLLIDGHKRVGDSWRFRYDSLKLFTPKSHSALPGLSLSGDQHSYPTKDEVADYLEEYARTFDLPVKNNTKVIKVSKKDGVFHILTDANEIIKSNNVVVATGPFQNPFTPEFSGKLPSNIVQVHSAYYKNPSQLNAGTALVVGGGNSGMQIATELSSNREVYISIGKKSKFLPYEVCNRSIFWWFKVLGISKLTVNSRLGQIMKKNDPIIGKEIKPLLKQGKVKMVPKTVDIKGQKVIMENGFDIEPKNIIWATGFRADYSWIENPKILDHNGLPIHERGVTKEKGLYFLGLSWQYKGVQHYY